MDNEIQDKYMDAVLAMLMDEYAEAEAEMLLQNSKDEIPEVEMPEELDRKCQALIRKKFVRKKRQHALEALGRASSVIILLRQLVAAGHCTKKEANRIAARIAKKTGADLILSM